MKQGYIYIISNKNRTTYYTGVTSNLKKRIAEHKEGKGYNFSKKYKLTDLLFFEICPNMQQAILREKQIKNWHREWKINQIKTLNPEMKDLFFEL